MALKRSLESIVINKFWNGWLSNFGVWARCRFAPDTSFSQILHLKPMCIQPIKSQPTTDQHPRHQRATNRPTAWRRYAPHLQQRLGSIKCSLEEIFWNHDEVQDRKLVCVGCMCRLVCVCVTSTRLILSSWMHTCNTSSSSPPPLVNTDTIHLSTPLIVRTQQYYYYTPVIIHR